MRAFTKYAAGPFADFTASQNSHCVYSVGFNLLAAEWEKQGAMAEIDTAKLAMADSSRALAEPDDAMLDAEYESASSGSNWPERKLWLIRNWRYLLSEAACYLGILAVLTMPVWVGPASKAIINWFNN
jgi:hypothetical protein